MTNENIRTASMDRFDFVNGARGIAALQVVLLHYCAFFFPAFARVSEKGNFSIESAISHTPLFYLIDGYTAVSIFFIMSGFVLTPAFEKSSLSIRGNIVKRFIRLFVPVTASILLSTILLMLFNEYKSLAAYATGSTWANSLLNLNISIFQSMKEVFVNSMVLGYQGQSLFSRIPLLNNLLTPLTASTNSPLWTLHVEFWGSLLTLMLAIFHRTIKNKKIFWVVFLGAIITAGTSHYSLFMAGFAAYHFRLIIIRERGFTARALGVLIVALGIFIASVQRDEMAGMVLSLASKITIMQAASPSALKTSIAAILILLGVCLSAPIRGALSCRLALWLGKISFSLYLIHFPLLFTLGAWVFITALAPFGYLSAVALTLVICIPTTLVAAHFFELYVDRTAIAASRSISKNFISKANTAPETM
jgi:peptidoglycan/LPS O-acetylase OafA/YrhL